MCAYKTTMTTPDKKFKLYYKDFPKWAYTGDLYTRDDYTTCRYREKLVDSYDDANGVLVSGYVREISNIKQCKSKMCNFGLFSTAENTVIYASCDGYIGGNSHKYDRYDGCVHKYAQHVRYSNKVPIASYWSTSKANILSIYKNEHKPDGVFKSTTQESRDDSWFPDKPHSLSIDFSRPTTDYTKQVNSTDLTAFPIVIVPEDVPTKFLYDGKRFLWEGSSKYCLEVVGESIMLVAVAEGRPFQCFDVD